MENNKITVCNEDSSSSVSMSVAGGPRRCSGTRSVSPGHNGGGGGVVTPTSSLRSTPSPSVLPVSAPPAQQQQLPPNKIISRNVNGTVAVTTIPTNEAELQLYRVMQKASLLSYYDTLLEMGGDDVQQLCDAGEEEFLEIMALIGMASKPLHVRRLQKALQEWMVNPALFQIPVISLNYGPGDIGASTANSRMLLHQATLAALQRNDVPESKVSRHSPTPRINDYPKVMHAPVHGTIPKTVTQNRQQDAQSPVSEVATSSCTVSSNVSGSPTSTPALTDLQITQISDNAERLTKLLPRVEPKHTGTKKKICKDLEHVMQMREDDPRRIDEIRRYAAIYGRFDCKRRSHKPLTLHEVLVNEAAAQICRRVPALLTRRDELFPLARQLVRDVDAHRYHADTSMSPARTRSMSTNSSDSETSVSGGDSKPKSPRSIDSSPGR